MVEICEMCEANFATEKYVEAFEVLGSSNCSDFLGESRSIIIIAQLARTVSTKIQKKQPQ